ncbi:hypothetical protein ACS0TY_002750 [Phlomoides rotata]
MTSASELFYQRRSRFGRNPDPLIVGSDLGISPPPPDRANRRHRNHSSTGGNHTRRNRLDPDACDRHHSRQTSHHRPTHPLQERESSRLEEGGQQHSLGNTSHTENEVNVQGRLRFSGNDRLPGAVLLARERLFQRLRGVTLSGSRISSSSNRNDISIVDEFRLIDAGDWETEIPREWLPTIVPTTHSISKRPPGLTQEALDRLSIEEFCIAGGCEEHKTSRESRECSICLENFLEGDELIRLPCNHRYHFGCLDPWVRSCGDCPYCRRAIDATLDGV